MRYVMVVVTIPFYLAGYVWEWIATAFHVGKDQAAQQIMKGHKK